MGPSSEGLFFCIEAAIESLKVVLSLAFFDALAGIGVEGFDADSDSGQVARVVHTAVDDQDSIR